MENRKIKPIVIKRGILSNYNNIPQIIYINKKGLLIVKNRIK